jgi:hypothetical protein
VIPTCVRAEHSANVAGRLHGQRNTLTQQTVGAKYATQKLFPFVNTTFHIMIVVCGWQLYAQGLETGRALGCSSGSEGCCSRHRKVSWAGSQQPNCHSNSTAIADSRQVHRIRGRASWFFIRTGAPALRSLHTMSARTWPTAFS